MFWTFLGPHSFESLFTFPLLVTDQQVPVQKGIQLCLAPGGSGLAVEGRGVWCKAGELIQCQWWWQAAM